MSYYVNKNFNYYYYYYLQGLQYFRIIIFYKDYSTLDKKEEGFIPDWTEAWLAIT